MQETDWRVLIADEGYPVEAMGGMCLKAEMNYLCFLCDIAELSTTIGDGRVCQATSISDNIKQIVLSKGAGGDGFTILITKDGKEVPLTYGSHTSIIIWSEKPEEVGMILGVASKEINKKYKNIKSHTLVAQKTPRYLGKPFQTDLPENITGFRIADGIEWYRQSSLSEEKINRSGASDRFDAKLNKLQQAMQKRDIDVSDANRDPYQILYEHLVLEIQKKLKADGLI